MAQTHLPHLQHVSQAYCYSPVHVIGKATLFVQPGDLHMNLYFGVVRNLTVPLLFPTSFIESLVKIVFPMDPRIVSTRSCLVKVSWNTIQCRANWMGCREMLRPIMTKCRAIAKDHIWKSHKVCHDPAERKSICITHDQQHHNHLQGATNEFDAKSNGPTIVKDC